MATKKGKVFVTTDRGSILPFPILKRYEVEIRKQSKQLKEERKWAEIEGLANRPYPPDSFLTLYESNPIFYATVNQIAVDVAGLGWRLILKEGQKENEKEREKVEEFLKKPNPTDSLRDLCKRLLIDWGTIGYSGLEVTRSNDNLISGLYHVPGQTIWVHIDKERFCQKRGEKKVWFKPFRLEKDFSAKEGKEGKYSIDDRANELIYFKNYYPRNDYYGVPHVLPATGSVLGLIGIRDYNLSFFTNFGVPAYLVTLSGEWKEGSDKTIRDFLNTEIKGSENAHKTMVLELPEGGEATFKPLSVEVKEGSFRVYQQILREDILAAYSMPPYRIGIAILGNLGGSTSVEATRVYVDSVIEPLQEDLEGIINQILEEGLGCEAYGFKFNDLDTRDEDADSKRYTNEIAYGAMTPNEARNLLGRGTPYAQGDRFYISAGLVEVGEAELEKREKEQFKFMAEQEKLEEEIKKVKEK